MILVLDDDAVMAECVMRVINKCGKSGQVCNNAIDGIAVVGEEVPEMVLMDIYLTGPDGFTFLNEMASYADTGKVPVVIISERDFSKYDLSAYGVVGVLDKNTMKPEDISEYIKKYCKVDDD